ncbi:MAG TPA: hypothetical protein VJR89_05685 [Polyangiales bacterium]|nr:hypothetical protein [Polyangiales bacterium]
MVKLVQTLGVVAAVALFACGEPSAPSPSVGSNSNWLRGCKDDSECGDALRCQCGLCTRSCEDDQACGPLSDALCARRDEPAAASCGDELSTGGVCLPRCAAGSCAESQACVDGTCVPFTLPDNALCQPVARTDAAQRTRVDELFALLHERGAAGIDCGDGRGPIVAGGWRLDARLICVARVLAADLDAGTASPGLVDASGRNTVQRMNMVGYTPRRWGEGFAVQARSPDHALRLMLNDTGNCQRFRDQELRDVGLANSGDAYVMTNGTSR